MKQLVFVYGTLKRGLCNAHYLDGQRFVGEARTLPEYRMFGLGGYPGMIAVKEGGRKISGEIWEVDERCKRRLDRLEGVDERLYEFVPVRLMKPFDDVRVMTYLYARDVSGCADAGDDWKG